MNDAGGNTGGDDGCVNLWDPAAAPGAELVCSLRGHSGDVWCVAFSRGGGRVASAGGDRTVRIWDARVGGGCIRVMQVRAWRVAQVIHQLQSLLLLPTMSLNLCYCRLCGPYSHCSPGPHGGGVVSRVRA